LLNSKSTAFPAGIANSSGTVGRYLTDSVGSSGSGYFPQLEKMPPHNHDGVGGMHMYMPWWKFDRKNEFPRGYHIEFGGGREMPGVGEFHALCHEEEGYGARLKQRARQTYGTYIGFAGRGEMLPNPDTYCEIDPEVVTARMGADPKTSVLNGFCQAHDVKNLFVTDGASLVTNPDKNPTLTIMALSWRASEYLLDEAKKGNL